MKVQTARLGKYEIRRQNKITWFLDFVHRPQLYVTRRHDA